MGYKRFWLLIQNILIKLKNNWLSILKNIHDYKDSRVRKEIYQYNIINNLIFLNMLE